MPGLSTKLKMGEYREVLFWLLLLGSWQFLALPGRKNGIVGAVGTAVFLMFASSNLDHLGRLGLTMHVGDQLRAQIGCTQR